MATRSSSSSPRIGDVAHRAGVSIGTVSNVLNHPDKVRESTIVRVREAISSLGFVRDANASSLAAGRSRSIGFVVIDLSNSIFVDAARGAQDTARQVGLNLLLAGSGDDFGVQGANVDFFNEARVAGMLIAPMQDSSSQIERMTRRGRPVVLVNYDPAPHGGCSVVIDNERVGYIAAKHLIETGATKLALVGALDPRQPVVLRRRGVRRAIAETDGAVLFEEIPTPDLTVGSGRVVGRTFARRDRDTRPDGVVAMTDTLAVGLIETLLELGVSIPDDVAVMGCDHNAAAQDCRIPVSTVAMRGYEMGVAAMRLLLDEMADTDDHHAHQRVVLEPELILRASTPGSWVVRDTAVVTM